MENKRCWNGYAERKIEKNLVPYYSGMAFVSRFVFWPDRRSLIDRVIWVTMAEYNGWCNCRIPSEFLLRHLLFFSSYVSIWCWYCSLPWRKIELNSPMPVNADFRVFFLCVWVLCEDNLLVFPPQLRHCGEARKAGKTREWNVPTDAQIADGSH